ncbi:glucokinase [Paenibacillus sp. J31TS4]|uniref:ROK family protein n=1 Tax=Paenibacillus sp. J31TS4 TaxID=2807195 RepID=UPI001B05B1D6|nr:ROK family protein [Paenibacillus sp. J31TS4]GIP38046.1 glucokinase [Paenibacillus sp. J31TS4]
MEGHSVGVDIGGTNTVIGLFDGNFALVGKSVIATEPHRGPGRTSNPASYLDALAREIGLLVEREGGGRHPVRVGIGVPGMVDPLAGVVLGASNLAWSQVPLAAELEARLGIRVTIDNDVRMYTLGECMAGAARGRRHVLCVTLGTGIAMGMMSDGRLIRGGSWYAGEIGHDPVDGESSRCPCGKTGCLETVASATGIARLASEAIRRGTDTRLRELGRPVNAYDVYEAAAAGDREAAAIFRFAGEVLGGKLATAVSLLDPEMLVIGGGVAAAGDYLLEPLRRTLSLRYGRKPGPVVTTGTLGDTAGLIGAVHYALARESEDRKDEAR